MVIYGIKEYYPWQRQFKLSTVRVTNCEATQHCHHQSIPGLMMSVAGDHCCPLAPFTTCTVSCPRAQGFVAISRHHSRALLQRCWTWLPGSFSFQQVLFMQMFTQSWQNIWETNPLRAESESWTLPMAMEAYAECWMETWRAGELSSDLPGSWAEKENPCCRTILSTVCANTVNVK